jgi:hypothetical protein
MEMTIGANQTEKASADRDVADAGAQGDSAAAPAAEDAAAAPGATIDAAVIAEVGAGDTTSYAMFEARDVSVEGAFLVGQLFFEVDETFTLKLSSAGNASVTVEERVKRLELDDQPGMAVAFTGLGDAERKALDELAARAAES